MTATGTDDVALHLDAFEQLVVRRRTNLLVDADGAVDRALVERLCRLATWAPNHKRTWPWRFAVFTGAGRSAIGEAFAADQRGAGVTDEAKLTKTATKYRRAPVIVVVATESGDDDERSGENRDSVAAGIQNLLLGASTAGLASFWSSPPARRGQHALDLCGFPRDATFVGVVYLGWPTGEPDRPSRPEPRITHVS